MHHSLTVLLQRSGAVPLTTATVRAGAQRVVQRRVKARRPVERSPKAMVWWWPQ